MPDAKKEAIKRFLDDTEMSKAVFSILRSQFMKAPKDHDVQSLAAAWMAKDIFEEAWKEINKLKQDKARDEKPTANIGL